VVPPCPPFGPWRGYAGYVRHGRAGLGEGWGIHFTPAGDVGQEKGDDTPCRFRNACFFWRQLRPGPHL